MASLTLTIDEDLLRQARIRALELGTSVNALVREYLESLTDRDRQQRATEEIIALAEQADANTGPEPWKWHREDLYEERLARYGR